MPITNTSRVLDYLPLAMGAYGTGPGTSGVNVGTAVPVAVKDFAGTPNSGFQATLYKDAVTGKYTVAIAGTDDLTDLVDPDRQLAMANLLSAVGSGAWDPQMTDAIKFTTEAFRAIQSDYAARDLAPPTLDQLRAMVDITGHSLGGALAELTAKFYGLAGANIDGPGVTTLVGLSEWTQLQSASSALFTDFKSDYTLSPSQFGAYAYTVVGVAGTHLNDIEVQRTPRALAAETAMFTAAGSMATGNIAGIGLSAALAGISAAGHPSGNILAETEALAGISPSGSLPVSPFSALRIGEAATLAAGSSTATALTLKADAFNAQSNVSAGLSPAGVSLDGNAALRGPFSVIAWRDETSGRLVEVFTHLDAQGNASGAPPIRKEYAVDAGGRLGAIDEAGNLQFVHIEAGNAVAVVSLAPDGAISYASNTGQSGSAGAVSPEIAAQMFSGRGDWVYTITDQVGAAFWGDEPLPGVSPADTQDGGDGASDTDTGAGLDGNAPVAPPAPSLTTIRINATTTFVLNQDGDIVSEHTALSNGYVQERDIGGEISYTDAGGNHFSPEQYQDQLSHHDQGTGDATANVGAATQYLSAAQALLGLGHFNDLSTVQQLGAIANLYNTAASISGSMPAINGGATSLLGFVAALESGNAGAIAVTGAQLGSQGLGLYADMLNSSADIAIQAGDWALGQAALAEAAAANAGAAALGQAVPYLNLALALSNVEENPAALLAAAVAFIPVVGPILSLFITIGSALVGDDGPDIAVGHIKADWDDNGQLSYFTLRNDEEGAREALSTMGQLTGGLQASLAKDGQYGLIPGALPSLVITREPGGDDTHPYALLWTDDRGQEQSRYYDPQGNKIFHPETGSLQGPLWSGAQDNYSAEGTQFAQDFVRLAAHYAIAPAADVEQMRQDWVQTVAQALPLEARAGELNALAEPLRPRTYVGGAEGDLIYDPGQDLERLAQIEGERLALEEQARALRAQALADLHARTAQVTAMGAEQPASAEEQITRLILADGSGTLYMVKDAQGNEVRLLDANNTREFDGQAEHTHGGERDPSVATDQTVEAGDADLHSTTSRTVASATVQTATTVAAGDTRVADGGQGQVLQGQDSTQQTHVGPGGTAVVGQAPAAADATVVQQPTAQAPEAQRATVTLGEATPSPVGAATQPEPTVQETSAIAQGQDATQQADGGAVLQGNGAAGTVLAGQAGGSQSFDTIEAGSAQVTSDEADTSDTDNADNEDNEDNAIPATGTLTVKAGDGRITSTAAAPAPRAPAAPAAPAVGVVPQQPTTLEQERRLAIAAMVQSAEAANPLGGDAGLAGLAAVGMAAAGAHLGAQAQPLVVQAQQVDLVSNDPVATPASGVAPTPVFQVADFATGQPGGSAVAGNEPATLQFTQVNLGSFQVGSVISQPAQAPASASAAVAEPTVRVVLSVEWQGLPPVVPAQSPAASPSGAGLSGEEARSVLAGAVFAVSVPVGGAVPAPAPAPAPAPDGLTGGGSGDDSGGGNSEPPIGVTPLVPATPLPSTLTGQQAFEWTDLPLLSRTVWGGAEDAGLLFSPEMLAPSRPGEGGMTFTAVSDVTGGQVALVNGQIVFRPDADFFGEASFSYTVRNGWGLSSTGTARLQIEPVNDAPEAQADSLESMEDQVLWIDAAGLLANDHDRDDDIAALRVASVDAASGGTAALEDLPDGSQRIVFTPDANFHGQARFNYTVTDPHGAISTATATLNIAAENDVPIATGEIASTDEDVGLMFSSAQLLANEFDADAATDGDTLRIVSVQGAQHGIAWLDAAGDVRFAPDANYHGPAEFTYTVADDAGATATASVQIDVQPVNDAPVALGETVVADEDAALVFSGAQLLANDFDADAATDGDTLRITSVQGAQHGVVWMDTSGDVRFVADANYHGLASFDYTVTDSAGASSTAQVQINLQAVNDAPIATGESAAVLEDTSLLFTAAQLLANDTDADIATDADVLHISAVSSAQGGTVWLQADGSVRFDPLVNYNGPAGFSYTVQDQAGAQSTATVALTILPVNDLPQLVGETVSSDEDVVLLIAPALLLANDSDIEGDALQITAVSHAVHGSVTLQLGADGQPQIEFVPEHDYYGAASFDYEVTDQEGGTSRATVVINLAEVNDAPVAVGDAFAGQEDTTVIIALAQLLANDTDVDGDILEVSAVGAAVGGTVQLQEGTVHFVPEPDYFGPASFVYTVQDGRGGQAQGIATLQIAPVNDAPVVAGEVVEGVEDTALVIAAQALLANDHDIDSQTLSIAAVGNAYGGTVALLPDGSIRFEPLADHTGPAGFDYTVQDEDGASSVASVVVNLAAVNDAPRLTGETISATEDTPLAIDAAALLANDQDVDGDHADLHITAVGNAAHGSVALAPDGRIVFTPDADYAGTAGFDYTVADAQGAASTVRATLNIAAVNDAPRLVGESLAADEDTIVRLTAAQLLANDMDVDGDSLGIVGVGDARQGSVVLESDGSIVFTPTLNYFGAASFTYTVSDGAGGVSTATVSLNLAAVNDAPTPQADHLSTLENQPLSVFASALLANDSDVDGPQSALQITTVGNAQNGSVQLTPDGQIEFTPDADFFGAAAFDYTVADADGGLASATAHVDVQWVNRAPVAAADTLATQDEDTNVLILAGGLLANDLDPDIQRGAPDNLRIHSVAAIDGETHGVVSLTPEGNVLFVPDADYAGPVRFSYVMQDQGGLRSGATASMTLANVNDAPTVVGEVIAAKGLAEVWIDPATLLANDSDPDLPYAPQNLQLVAVGGAEYGTVQLAPDGRVLFTPDTPGAIGSFTYTVQDADGATAQGLAQVNTGNSAPVALGESIALLEDQVRVFSQAELLANDTDADNSHSDLRISAVGGASGGTVALDGQGQVVFTPTLNYNGAARFNYTVADGDGGTAQATVSLTLAPVNDAPVAVGEAFYLQEDQVATITTAALLANDTDVDGPGPLSVSGISNVTGGTASWQGSQVVFTPNANYFGWGGFNYTVQDGAGGASQARADLYFSPVNDAPVVNNELFSGYQDTTYTFSQASLLANDTDVESPGQLSISQVYGAQHGSAYLSGSNVVFTPQAGYSGAASFQYVVSDPDGGQGVGTTTINLARVNHSPVAVDDSFSTLEDLPLRVTPAQLLANDSDDGGAANLRVSWVGSAVGGTVQQQGDGSALFTPHANYNGPASFSYQVTDADNASTTATAYVNVASVNDAPVANNDYGSAYARISVGFSAADLLVNDYDPDGPHSGLRIVGFDQAFNGSVGWAVPNESLWFLANNAGQAGFRYTIQDAEGAQASAWGYLTVSEYDHGGFGPLALDMDGDGVELVSAAASVTFADIDGDGVAERLGWVGPDDAVLAYDADDNGLIDIATETTFTKYVPGALTDLEGLAAFDTDGDGLITAADTEWARFGALRDGNANGAQDTDEFQKLDALGIQSISLQRQGTPSMVEGNLVFGTAAVTHTDGTVTQAADVMFAVAPAEPAEPAVPAEPAALDETAHFNNLAQSFTELCVAVAAEPTDDASLEAVASLADLSLVPPEALAIVDSLVEAANAGTITVAASG